MDKIRYEIVSETEDKMRQMCELAAQDEGRKWAMVWAERENLSTIANQEDSGDESFHTLTEKAIFLEALLAE
jgi:hypothetical protein